jgi:DNA-binding MarR family transcriptional regulator
MPGYRTVLFERDHAIEILLILKDKGTLPLMDLSKLIVESRTAVRSRVNELAKAGMVRAEVVRDPRRRTMVSLTMLGEEITDKLAEIEKMLKR